MKKTFISLFSVSALFLMLLFPVSVKAGTTLSFLYSAWDGGNQVTDGDFSWSGHHGDAVKQITVGSEAWTGIKEGTTATTRNTINLEAGTYTFTITASNSNDENIDLPTIQINSGSPITAAEGNNSSYSAGVPKNITYEVELENQTNCTISVYFPKGDRDRFRVKNLIITQNAPACSGETVTVDANNEEYGTVTGGGSYCAGVQVDLEATPNSGYRFVNWTVTSGSADINDVNSASAHFTMSNPAAAVTVQANFEVNPCTDTKLVEAEDYIIGYSAYHFPNGSPQIESDASLSNGKFFNFNGNDEGKDGEINFYVYLPAATYSIEIKHRNGKDKYLNIYSEDPDGDVTYNTVKYKKMNAYNPYLGDDYCGDWKTFTYNNVELTTDGYYLIGLYGKQYAMFDYIKFTANTGVFCPNTITMQKNGDASAADPTSSVGAAMPGATVTVTAGEASANHNFVNWTASPSVEFLNANASSTTFVMPANAVTITANYEASVSSALTFSAGEGGSITSATAGGNDISSGDEVISGTSVTLTAEANSNYVFINWTDNNNNDAVVSTNAAFTFSMPATATSYTANFTQIDNVIITGDVASPEGFDGDGSGTMNITSVADFDAFNHNVLKFAYSNMDGGKYKGQKVAIDEGYSSSASAQATGFGFYYKTEKADDHVAFCFEVSSGEQVKWQLAATNNEWKYFYFPHAGAASWNGEHITIFMNGDDIGNYSTWNGQGTHTTYKDGGAFYMSEIAATSITLKPEIDSYTYTRNSIPAYGTLCLPMAGTVTGATLYSVAGKQEEGGKLYIVLEEQTDLEAGEPYIFEANGSTLTATMSGPQSAVIDDANGLVGTYTEIPAPAYSEDGDHNYVLAPGNDDNVVFKKVGSDVTVGAYRAYININNVSAFVPAPAMGRRYIRFGVEGQEQVVAIEMISDDASMHNSKVLQNGQLFIIRDGHIFNAQGAKIK